MRMPPLETARLLIRPFVIDDLDVIHRILDIEPHGVEFGTEGVKSLGERKRWLQWTVLGYEEVARLRQPPYGDRAIVLKASHQLIGACGFVPCLSPFRQLPSLSRDGRTEPRGLASTEFGLFYAISRSHQRQRYATEAARAMVDYAFGVLRLARVVATTTRDNTSSIGVMRNIGMRIVENPYPDPPWLQVVGVIENGRATASPPAVS